MKKFVSTLMAVCILSSTLFAYANDQSTSAAATETITEAETTEPKEAIVYELTLDKAIEMASSCQTALFFYEKGGKGLSENLKSDVKSVAIFIGSEGGFEESEVEKAEKNGVLTTSLGKRILRCETAPLCALSAIMYITGNL